MISIQCSYIALQQIPQILRNQLTHLSTSSTLLFPESIPPLPRCSRSVSLYLCSKVHNSTSCECNDTSENASLPLGTSSCVLGLFDGAAQRCTLNSARNMTIRTQRLAWKASHAFSLSAALSHCILGDKLACHSYATHLQGLTHYTRLNHVVNQMASI
jgi:hypothetical protein